jgi:hypothetical protein
MFLPSRCLIGRSPASDLVLAEKNVSGQHAVLEWTGVVWQLQDLGSRNGTYVDNQRIGPDVRFALQCGHELRFGRESAPWIVRDIAAPVAMARNLSSREWQLAEGGYLSLPRLDAHECAIYQLPDGTWALERDSEVAPLEDRATVPTGAGALWRIFLPVSLGTTMREDVPPVLVTNLRLRFRFSLDEEQVEMTGYCGDTRLDFGIRAHHYPLLLLARRRLSDHRAPEADQGWLSLDDLLRMLNMSESHLNISIHRARTHLSQAGVLDAASLIERKPRTRRLRLGLHNLELMPLDVAPTPGSSL